MFGIEEDIGGRERRSFDGEARKEATMRAVGEQSVLGAGVVGLAEEDR